MLVFDNITDSSSKFISAHGTLVNTEVSAFDYVLLETISPHWR